MSFFRSMFLIYFFSVFAAMGLLFLGYKLIYGEYRGAYAVLTTDESVKDKTLRDLLAADREFSSGQVYSESSQWVLLDEFGSLAQIPLDEYSSRIMPFDPRNDGYAEKLKNIFVSNGKRFVFIPLEQGIVFPAFIEKRLAGLLGDLSYSVDFFGIGKTLRFFFGLFAAASLGVFFLCNRKKNERRCLAGIVPCLPVLASLAFFYQAGIAMAALLLGLAVLLWKPFFEFCVILHITPKGSAERQRRLSMDVYEPYKLYLFFLPLFPLAFIFIGIHADILPLFVFAVFILYGVIFFISVWNLSYSGYHRLFRPVLIVKRRFPDFSFSVYMLPFVIAVLIAAFFSHQTGAGKLSANNFIFSGKTITEAEYYDHLFFQSSFSQRSMDRDSLVYPAYSMGDDGLLSPSSQEKNALNFKIGDFPPFPLKDLMNFIDYYSQSAPAGIAGRGSQVNKDRPLLILLVFLIPCLFIRKKTPFENNRLSALKGISGKKLRWGDKKHKKILLLINKAVPKNILELKLLNKQNTMFVRKDA